MWSSHLLHRSCLVLSDPGDAGPHSGGEEEEVDGVSGVGLLPQVHEALHVILGSVGDRAVDEDLVDPVCTPKRQAGEHGIRDSAHGHGARLVVDNTFATPYLQQPLTLGADIVVHSLSKTAGTGGNAIAGGIVARHGITSRHLDDEQRSDYALWLKLWPFRDSGPCMTPMTAHYLLNEMRTLRLKMAQMSSNTMTVARFLSEHPKV